MSAVLSIGKLLSGSETPPRMRVPGGTCGRPPWGARMGNPYFILPVAIVAALVAVFAVPSSVSHAAATDGGLSVGSNAQVVWDSLNLRTGPDLEDGIITTMPEGTVVSVIHEPQEADGYQWWEVKLDETVGFAAGAGLAPAGPNVPSCPAPCTLTPGTVVLVVNTDILHLRTSHSVHCQILRNIREGETLTLLDGPVMEDGYHWWHVQYQGMEGYAAGEWLAPVGSSISPTSCSADCLASGHHAVVADTPYLHLRASHTVHCQIILVLPEGSTVEVLDGPIMEDGYHWWHVNYQGTDGYAAGEWLVPA